jgi:hypothetical protein
MDDDTSGGFETGVNSDFATGGFNSPDRETPHGGDSIDIPPPPGITIPLVPIPDKPKDFYGVNQQPIPEPSSMALFLVFGLALIFLALLRRA